MTKASSDDGTHLAAIVRECFGSSSVVTPETRRLITWAILMDLAAGQGKPFESIGRDMAKEGTCETCD